MPLRYQDFLNKAVDEAIESAIYGYGGTDDKKSVAMLQGAIAGLNACRNLSPPQLHSLLQRTYRVYERSKHPHRDSHRFSRVSCFKGEVEWICKIISVVLVNQGIEPILEPLSQKAIDFAALISQESDPLHLN